MSCLPDSSRRSVKPVPWELIAFGRKIMQSIGRAKLMYMAEGRNSSLVISRWEDGAIQIDVNGHVEATTEPYDMRLQRMVGHLAGLLHPNPKSVLGIGFGAGVSAGTFTRYPTVEHITVCEIEPLIPPTSTRFFGRQNYSVMTNPKTRIEFDDARHYLMTTSNKYDIIASDPLDVFVKGTAALYSKEYFEAVKRHLNPGGMFTLYVPLYETDLPTIKSELATFFEAFPYSTIWANTIDGQGYDMVFMGHLEPPKIDIDEVQARLDRPDYAPVADSLREIELYSLIDLFSNYVGQNADLNPWVQGAAINRDGDLKLQYLGGLGYQLRYGGRAVQTDAQLPADSHRPVLRLTGKGAGAPAVSGSRSPRAVLRERLAAGLGHKITAPLPKPGCGACRERFKVIGDAPIGPERTGRRRGRTARLPGSHRGSFALRVRRRSRQAPSGPGGLPAHDERSLRPGETGPGVRRSVRRTRRGHRAVGRSDPRGRRAHAGLCPDEPDYRDRPGK